MAPEILGRDEIEDLVLRVIRLDIDRDALLLGLSKAYRSGFRSFSQPLVQIRADLVRMNDPGERDGEDIPLANWLRSAAFHSMSRPDDQRFYSELGERAAIAAFRYGDRAAGPAASGSAFPNLPEKILFRNAMLPHAFLARGLAAAAAVARLRVPVHAGGQPTGDVLLGTGWLAGERLLLTCHHVAVAAASGRDAGLQAAATEATFGYDAQGAGAEPLRGLRLVQSNETLDYALLELPADPPASPKPLRLKSDRPFDPAGCDQVAVNIIQHPEGLPKQLAIRNNVVAAVHGDDLAYFTDTSGGSSGSPVCDDNWDVLALHKASTPGLGKFNFQGRETAWVNIGTQIGAIVADLARHDESIRARLNTMGR